MRADCIGTPVLNSPDSVEFADEWIGAWNAHDVEALSANYADYVVFTSPTALRFAPESEGTIFGKEALRHHWTVLLAEDSDLHLRLVGVYAGVDTMVLHYLNRRDGLVNEVLTFRNGLIAVGHATHLQD